MAPVRTLTALRQKRDDLAKVACEYERRLAKARADLDHINGAIALFETTGDIHRLFRKGEAMTICKAALQSGPMTALQMVACIMEAKGLDAGDLLVRKAIGARLANSLAHQERRGWLVVTGKFRTARHWRLP